MRTCLFTLLRYSRQLSLIVCLLGVTCLARAENFEGGVFEFQKKMAESGNPQAQFKLGNMYETGRSVTVDLNAAVQWYEKSAKQNFTPAKHRLVYLQIKKTGYKPEHKAWLAEVRADADAGDGEAMMLLGELNEQGIGMPRNLTQAQAEYKRASVKGISGADSALYAITDLLNKQKIQAQQDESARIAAEKARKEDADREAQRKKSQQEAEQTRQTQLKLEAEQRKLEEERRRLEAQRQQLEEQKRNTVIQTKPAPATAPAESKETEEAIKSNTCTGKAAAFRTQCQ